MLEEAAPLTEPPRGGWLGEWLLSVLGMRWVLFSGRAVTVYAVTALVGDCSRGTPRYRVLGF